tara:strand:- start:8110 stop:9762 length:1653 start_codon:yes stop_codon:yes gene_type:complete
MKIKLSIVTTGRNDDYIKNFISRLEYVVNYTLEKCNSLGQLKSTEFIIVDWGSKKKLSDNFNCTQKKFLSNVKFLEISRKDTLKLSKEIEGSFFTEKAINLGISKASGEYVLYITADTIFSKNGLNNIFNIIKNKKINNDFFLIPRKYIDTHFYLSDPSFLLMDNHLNRIFSSKIIFPNTQFQNGGGASAFFFKKKIFNEANGFDVNAINKGRYSGSDAEIYKRISINNNHIDSTNFGIFGFKLPRLDYPLRNMYHKKRGVYIYSLDAQSEKKYNKIDTKIKIKHPYKVKSEISIGSKNINLNFKKIYNFLKIFWHTIYNKENSLDFYVNWKLIKYMFENRIQTFLNFGLNKVNRIASISKIFSFIDLYSFDIQTYENQNFKSKTYTNLNRYLNRTHNGYYRFTLTTKNKKIPIFFKENKGFSSIINIDVTQFNRRDLKIILSLVNRSSKNFSLIIFENIKDNQEFLFKNLEVKKIRKNFKEVLIESKYLIFDNKNNLKEFIKAEKLLIKSTILHVMVTLIKILVFSKNSYNKFFSLLKRLFIRPNKTNG